MSKVITYKKLKDETETAFSMGDVLAIIEENLGSDIVEAILDFQTEESEENKPNIINYIEDGIFSEQIRESGVVARIVQNILIDLEDQGYLKKSKNINKFIPNEDEIIQFIDDELSPGMMSYFE